MRGAPAVAELREKAFKPIGILNDLGVPRFSGQLEKGHAMTIRISIDDLTHQDPSRFTAQQKTEAVELCQQQDLSCNVFAYRPGLPSSS